MKSLPPMPLLTEIYTHVSHCAHAALTAVFTSLL